MRALLPPLLLLAACASEPVSTGVFTQSSCGGEGLACDEGFVYQLHIGRYGDAVTGLVVRYRYTGPGFNFAKSNECGCFIIESGVTDGEDLSFQVFLPGAPGVPEPGFENPDCAPIPSDCSDRRFELDGVDDGLVGSTSCGDRARADISFERVEGRPRTACFVP